VGILDQLTEEVVPDIGVLRIVLPGDRKLFGAEAAGGPKNERVGIILDKAVDGLFPFGEAHDGHSHERDVVAAKGKGGGVPDRSGAEDYDSERKTTKKSHVSHW
jgi:hypothetical protein